MKLEDFKYDLPEELIADFPLEQRTASRMLHVCKRSGQTQDKQFSDFISMLNPDDLLVFNDTKVMQARLRASKATGGQVSLLIERVTAEREALAHIKSNKKLALPCKLYLEDGSVLDVIARKDNLYHIVLGAAYTITDLMVRYGEVPLPPYIKRTLSDDDKSRYQTVYAKHLGAAAAPTAGLHFDQLCMDRIKALAIDCAYVTLHVGAGTFSPVRHENLDDHVMHSEHVEVTEKVVSQVQACRERGGRVVAVGTTVVRSLEAACQEGLLQPYSGECRLFIRPPYQFHCIDALLTNFHLPGSTLLMLICALAGYSPVMQAYKHAVANEYRFFSYGDAMLIV
jgi:S-adenosylmethionine:tRNA ribosyltransferase-isomerase